MGNDLVAQTAQADEDRTRRAFVSFLTSALGVDQTYATDDMYPSNRTGQYTIANPDGTVSRIGQPVSNVQGGGTSGNTGVVVGGQVFPLPLLMLLAGVWFLLKR